MKRPRDALLVHISKITAKNQIPCTPFSFTVEQLI